MGRVVPVAGEIGGGAVEDDAAANEDEPLDERARPRRTRARRRGSSRRARGGARRAARRTPPVRRRRRRPWARRGRAASGSPASAFAMYARCCCPPESVAIGVSAALAEADAARSPGARPRDRRAEKGRSSPRRGTRPAETSSRTVTGASIPEQRPLREVAERELARANRSAGSPKRQRLALCRPLQPQGEPDERRLSAAVRAGDADELALRDVEVDALRGRGGPPG